MANDDVLALLERIDTLVRLIGYWDVMGFREKPSRPLALDLERTRNRELTIRRRILKEDLEWAKERSTKP